MRFLCAFIFRFVFSFFQVFFSIPGMHFLFYGFHCCITQVHAIRTHVSDFSAFVEALCNEHGFTYSIPKFTTCLLLQSTCSKWCSRAAFRGLHLYIFYLICSAFAGFQEFLCTFFYIFSCSFCLELHQAIINSFCRENCFNFKTCLGNKSIDLSFFLHDKLYSHTLHPTSTKSALLTNFSPEYRA